MASYEERAKRELILWKKDMLKDPLVTEKVSHTVQSGVRNLIPQSANRIVTDAIKAMTKATMSGSAVFTDNEYYAYTLKERDEIVREKTEYYRKSGTVSGAVTGYGGIFMGMADFPILLSIKMKLLFEICTCYGFDVNDPKERLFMLTVFQAAFSRREKRKELYFRIQDWETFSQSIPSDIDQYDWTDFRQEYCDYIDLAKLLQMIPGVGAVFGAVANNRLIRHLSETAVQAYHLRLLSRNES